MSQFVVCNIYCPEENDFEILKEYLSKYPVYLHRNKMDEYNGKPTLIVGWENALEASPKQNIHKKKINNTISWTFGGEEDKDEFISDVKEFVNNSLINWLPKDHIVYDPFFDGNLLEWERKNIDHNFDVFSYYDDGALYLNNNGNNFIINSKSMLYADNRYVDTLTELINNTTPLSYNNIKDIVNIDNMNTPSMESMFWVKNGIELDEKTYFNIIPGFDHKRYIPFFMSLMGKFDFDEEEKVFLDRMIKRDIITSWCSSSLIPVTKDFNADGKEKIYEEGKYFLNLNFSNKRTITNRIVCKDTYNIQSEPKNSLRRKEIKSQYEGGKILVCDYTSFETRISLFLSKDKDFIEKYKSKDLHYEVGKTIFEKEVISNKERDFSKLLNHAFLYGASHGRLISMLSKEVSDPERSLYFVKKQLSPIVSMVERVNEEAVENGYVKTPWGLIVKPDKEFAAYNNMVQATATEIMVDKLCEIKDLLADKKSNFLFQIHDSMIFDIHPEEMKVANDILKTLSKFKKTAFTIEYKVGENYLELSDQKYFIYS